MQQVVERIAAEQLELLDADRGQHRDRRDALALGTDQAQRDPTTHAEAEQMRALDSEAIEPLADVGGVRLDGVVGSVERRGAEAGHVGSEHEAVPGQERSERPEVVGAPGRTVKQHDGSLALDRLPPGSPREGDFPRCALETAARFERGRLAPFVDPRGRIVEQPGDVGRDDQDGVEAGRDQ